MFVFRLLPLLARAGLGAARLLARSGLRGGGGGGGGTPAVRFGAHVEMTRDNFAAFGRQVHQAGEQMVAQVAQQIADDMRANAPVRSGRLGRSITVGPLGRNPDGTASVTIFALWYGEFVERLRPHIRPALKRGMRNALAVLARQSR